jgi:hypothetical protein
MEGTVSKTSTYKLLVPCLHRVHCHVHTVHKKKNYSTEALHHAFRKTDVNIYICKYIYIYIYIKAERSKERYSLIIILL